MVENNAVIHLYHYFEKEIGPFKNLSDLPIDKARAVLSQIKANGSEVLAAHRREGYLERRQELEQLARQIFMSKGGKPKRTVPHYMVVGECPWLETWFREGEFVKVEISRFKRDEISFTYGDLFPTFSPRVMDNKEYRRQVYTYEEIVKLIDKYGLPQKWNCDGQYGPERYIEVQVWSDDPLSPYERKESQC